MVKDQIRWLWLMAVISCLLMGAVEIGNGIRQFVQKDREGEGITIAAETPQLSLEEDIKGEMDFGKNVGQTEEQKHADQEMTGEEHGSSLKDLSAAAAGILKGSVGMAREILEQKAKPQFWETEASYILGEDSQEEPGPPVIWLVSDLHYISSSATDYGEAFERFQAKSDGKVMRYLPQILDTVMDEAISDRPDAVILTGDITMNGEKINHMELAEKLSILQASGIQVLVIPGNHDINNTDASVYFGETAERTEEVTPTEYEKIYEGFGPSQAVSRDEASFSYVYALRDDIWLMLLDTAQYEPRNVVEGMVRPKTFEWMEENLRAAEEQGIQIIVLGHHNLLSESTMFTTMCVLENGKDVTKLLESYHVPLYISGHLHLQRVKKNKKEPSDTDYGICEIVSDAVSIPPCQYGIVAWQDNGDIYFHTRETDVAGWAEKNGLEDENLLNFSEYKEEYIRQLIEDQIREKTKQVRKETSDDMARIYGDVYADYCAGLKIDQRQAMSSWEYSQWQQHWPTSKQAGELKAMIRDSQRDSNNFILEKSSYHLSGEE